MAWLRGWLQHQWLCAAALCSLALLLCLLLLRALRRAAHAQQQQQTKASGVASLGLSATTPPTAFTTPLPPSNAPTNGTPVTPQPTASSTSNSNASGGYMYASHRNTATNHNNNNVTYSTSQATSNNISNNASSLNASSSSVGQPPSLALKSSGSSSYGQVSNHYGYIGAGAYGATYNAYDPYVSSGNELYGYSGYNTPSASKTAFHPLTTSTSAATNNGSAYGYGNGAGYTHSTGSGSQAGGLQAHRTSNNGLYGVTGNGNAHKSGGNIYGQFTAQYASNSNNASANSRALQISGLTGPNVHSQLTRSSNGSASSAASSSNASRVSNGGSTYQSYRNVSAMPHTYNNLQVAPAQLHASGVLYGYSGSSNASANSDQPILNSSGLESTSIAGAGGGNGGGRGVNAGWV
jgi:hypothetical protein